MQSHSEVSACQRSEDGWEECRVELADVRNGDG